MKDKDTPRFRINPVTLVLFIVVFLVGWQLGKLDLKFQWENYHPEIQVKNQQPPADKQAIDFKLFWDTWNLVSR